MVHVFALQGRLIVSFTNKHLLPSTEPELEILAYPFCDSPHDPLTFAVSDVTHMLDLLGVYEQSMCTV